MDTISLSRTVFEIFDFKVFRVWPWPLTLKVIWGQNIFKPFESPYMTCYLTSMDKISLRRTVFEIFDFKVFRVWPWPLTPKGHLGSKKIYAIRKPIYDFLFDFYVQHLSISYRFRDIRRQVFRVWPWLLTPKRSSGVKKFYTIRKSIYELLFDFYGQES